MPQINQEPDQNKLETKIEALGNDHNVGQEEKTSEDTSVDTSETVEDEGQYDHMGDNKFVVDNKPEFTSQNEYDVPTSQRTGFTKDFGPGK